MGKARRMININNLQILLANSEHMKKSVKRSIKETIEDMKLLNELNKGTTAA